MPPLASARGRARQVQRRLGVSPPGPRFPSSSDCLGCQVGAGWAGVSSGGVRWSPPPLLALRVDPAHDPRAGCTQPPSQALLTHRGSPNLGQSCQSSVLVAGVVGSGRQGPAGVVGTSRTSPACPGCGQAGLLARRWPTGAAGRSSGAWLHVGSAASRHGWRRREAAWWRLDREAHLRA